MKTNIPLRHFGLVTLLSLGLSGCGGGDTCVGADCTTPKIPYVAPEPVGYVGDDVGDYTYKYTSHRGFGTAAEDYAPQKEAHFGYREPDCKFAGNDEYNYDNGDKKSVALAWYYSQVEDRPTGFPVMGETKASIPASGVYRYRETYDFKRIDGKHMSFTHKISLHSNYAGCTDLLPFNKHGEITRTGENTDAPTITNPNLYTPSRTWSWDYFLYQRTGTTMFTWVGKTVLPTGESVDKFEVDLPPISNRTWDTQSSPDTSSVGGVDLRSPIFDGKSKAKALVYMRRSSAKSDPWAYGEFKIIMDPNAYKTDVPLDKWQTFKNFRPEWEPLNDYPLPSP